MPFRELDQPGNGAAGSLVIPGNGRRDRDSALRAPPSLSVDAAAPFALACCNRRSAAASFFLEDFSKDSTVPPRDQLERERWCEGHDEATPCSRLVCNLSHLPKWRREGIEFTSRYKADEYVFTGAAPKLSLDEYQAQQYHSKDDEARRSSNAKDKPSRSDTGKSTPSHTCHVQATNPQHRAGKSRSGGVQSAWSPTEC
ncbi:hypothetical protein MTO96_020758 [Rhipicephalus appendiculatus]